VKLYFNEQKGSFTSFGRVISGTIKEGDDVRIMGEGYTTEEQEDVVVKTVEKLWIMQPRYKI
jgi:U5 small nuclear ribonucleoprotein component